MSINPIIAKITSAQLRNDIPDFRPGDTVRVHALIVEGERERVQLFEGLVIKRRGQGISEVPESVAPGATVELWHTSPEADDGTSADAELLVSAGIVRNIDEGSSLGMRSMAVEVLVPQADLPAVLKVLSRDERLDVIGVPGAPLPRQGVHPAAVRVADGPAGRPDCRGPRPRCPFRGFRHAGGQGRPGLLAEGEGPVPAGLPDARPAARRLRREDADLPRPHGQ